MVLSICKNAQQTYNNINECLTKRHICLKNVRELQGFALVNPRLSTVVSGVLARPVILRIR